jgi:hypothetical protein
VTRIAAYIAGIAAIAGLLCLPALLWSSNSGGGGGETYEPTRITSYRASFTVAANGDLTAVEDLDLEVSTSDRHGIYRFFDRYDANAPEARRTPTDISVSRDGRPEPFEKQSQDLRRHTVLKIGEADRTLSTGVHHYAIRYRIPGVLIPGDATPSAFYWNVVPGGWQQEISDVDVSVSLPAPTEADVRCVVGWGGGQPCTVAGGGTDRLTLHVDHLPARTPVTVRTGLAVAAPAAGGRLPWAPRFDPVLGTSPTVLGIVLLLGLAGAVVGGHLGALARERRPSYPLTYAPPDGLGPAQAAYILEEKVDREAYVASLLHAAGRGAVRLDRADGAWSISALGARDGTIDSVTTEAYRRLTGAGTFTVSRRDVDAGSELASALGDFTGAVKKWGISSGNLSRTGLGGFGGLLVISGLVLVVVCAVVQPFGMSMLGIVPGAFAVCGASMARAGAGTRRTREGRELWSRIGGFKRILETPSSKHRFDFSGRQELYTAYIPWAVAFGCAKQWAQKYRTEVGTEPPVPAYFGAYAGAHTGDYVDSMVHDFDSTVGSAISSYNATQHSSSGGGGFSGGGGGGGGGGGSW